MQRGTMASKKTQRAISAHDVPRVFDDVCIDRLAQIAEVPQLAPEARDRLALAIREAARIYAEDARKPNINAVHDEIERLHQAASRREYEQVALLIDALSPDVRQRFETREATPGFENAGLKFPSAEALRDPERCYVACDVVRQFCSVGIGPHQRPLLFAPERIKRPTKREAERQFVINLRLAWLETTDTNPTATVNPARSDRPFASFAQECLTLVGAPYADAVGLINELNRRRKASENPPAV
jgi:hypothetical protein